ncbi:hypothetical protein P2318_33640 [Myxococcaceae bacterium GXIMD 01537]
MGFGLTAGGYLLYCTGLPQPVLVPESHVDLGGASAEPVLDSIYPDRDTALTELAAHSSEAGRPKYAWYRGAGGQLIVPTLFSPATTPRIARTMSEVRAHLGQSTQRELKVLLLALTGTKVLQGIFSRVLRVGAELEPGPPLRPARKPTLAPAPPAPASGPLAPSPGLIQALSGRNPTPSVVPGPRLPRDAAIKPTVPRPLPSNRPISSSPTQNAQLQADIQYLQSVGARNIRVNQQQVSVENVERVGANRPDLQFDHAGRRYHVEYDTPTSNRGPSHQSRIASNDPDAEIILIVVP